MATGGVRPCRRHLGERCRARPPGNHPNLPELERGSPR